ncbi:WxL domain-containing protein [Companilactobacillus metriopterae]|uniref:WxL domain-containing protein n=1 Tax=Companilactobacillus metriopterae TaxID=1909267 RepID=UPI00100BC8E5|nr:WxL domain-containing protein [Companilactobacillus metriopterae]
MKKSLFASAATAAIVLGALAPAATANAALATDASSNPQSATSEANVTVASDMLTLDAVPDFGFGTVAAGTIATLDNNDSVINNDGNAKGLLQVTDSRTATAGKTAGYEVSASMTAFTDGTTPNNDFVLHLASVDLKDSANANITGVKTNVSNLNADGTSKATVLANNTYGSARATFVNPEDASLAVPATAAQKGKAASYTSTITWTLTAKTAE